MSVFGNVPIWLHHTVQSSQKYLQRLPSAWFRVNWCIFIINLKNQIQHTQKICWIFVLTSETTTKKWIFGGESLGFIENSDLMENRNLAKKNRNLTQKKKERKYLAKITNLCSHRKLYPKNGFEGENLGYDWKNRFGGNHRFGGKQGFCDNKYTPSFYGVLMWRI